MKGTSANVNTKIEIHGNPFLLIGMACLISWGFLQEQEF
jgi:hypothetical protein